MSTEIVPSPGETDVVTELLETVAIASSESPLSTSESIPSSTELGEQMSISASVLNTTDIEHGYSDTTVFEIFIGIEILMTTIELIVSIVAAIKMPRWRRNYRNQMLMQLTFARFIKRIIFTVKFMDDHHKITHSTVVTDLIHCFRIYIDFVIVILVFFFIKHMYNSLIIVLVKISHNSFYRVLTCSWLIPIPISIGWTVVIITEFVDEWYVNLFICSLFRWPLIFLGTGLYLTIVYRVLSDKIRQFARSLTVVTFFLCLTINVYLFSKDVFDLWCIHSLSTLIISYISGFLMNVLILILYIVLIMLSYNNKAQSSRSLPEYSLADVNVKC